MSKEVLIGGGVSDWKFRKNFPKASEVPHAWNGLTHLLEGDGIEIQIGFKPPPWRLPIKSHHSFIGFHQPGERKKRKDTPKLLRPLKPFVDKADIVMSMNLAQQAHADYYVIHPYEKYKEGVSKDEKKTQAIKFIKDTLRVKRALGHTYRVCIENLNDPAYPTSVDEIVDLLTIFKGEKVGLILDIDHHWYDFQQTKQKSPGSTADYYAKLESDLSKIIQMCGSEAIEGFHLAQAYSDEEGKKWTMHGLPGLLNGQTIAKNATPLLFTAPVGFKGEWLNVGKTLSIIRSLAEKHSIENLKVLIEANSEETEIAASVKQLKEAKEELSK